MQMTSTRSLFTSLAAAWLLGSAPGAMAQMAGPGMMGGGWGPGMMEGYRAGPRPEQVDPRAADALRDYVRSRRLACMQCHAIAGGGAAPSYAQVAAGYAGRPDAVRMVVQAIVRGAGPMPGGLASPAQAHRLAGLILDLERPPR